MPIDLKAAMKNQSPDESEQDQKIRNYFDRKDAPIYQEKADESVDPQEEYEPDEREVGEIIHQWEAPEFEAYEKSDRWYLIFGAFIVAIIIYALVTNSPLMAITFILLGVVGYIYMQKDPRIITFSITSLGIVADKEMYLYENIKSFWIFYDPPHDKTLSLHTNASMLPFIHIPIEDEDPTQLREILVQFIDEKKQSPSMINTLEKIFHI